ncbi:MAG TPA: alpha/beta hydrolase [Rhodoglobus sp.]|nr:alpha/beta hydrolase [Rhodoglobus sp.]
MLVRIRRATTVVVGLLLGFVLMVLSSPSGDGWRVSDLARITQLTAAERQAFLDAHAGVPAQIVGSTPQELAIWWTEELREGQRLRLLATVPEVIGNLPGADYATRDQANRMHLRTAIAEAQTRVAEDARNGVAAERLAALQAIEGALRAPSVAPRYLVQLTDDEPPLTAIAIGDLDTASRVTFVVPGMGTESTDMQLWARAAENVYAAQGEAGAPASRAVVAWMGYRAPPVGLEATRDTYAEGGAPLLRRDVEALVAVRSSTWQPGISVVAHSYGATMAALALAQGDLGVYSFVMLGSAGVNPRLTADDLHADHVYAGEARADTQARWGRIDRRDPRTVAFGARVIRTNGGDGLRAVTGHAPVLHSPWNDDPASPLWMAISDPEQRALEYTEHMASAGYLDPGTESLAQVARITYAPLKRAWTVAERDEVTRLRAAANGADRDPIGAQGVPGSSLLDLLGVAND